MSPVSTYYQKRTAREVAFTMNARDFKNVFPCGQATGKKSFALLNEAGKKKLKTPRLYGEGAMLERVYNKVLTPEDLNDFPWDCFLVGLHVREMIVLDLDSKQGQAFVDAVEALQLALPHYMQQTTINNGRHFIVRLPQGVKATNGQVFWNGVLIGETRAGNAYICVYQPDQFTNFDDLPEFDPDELPEGLTVTNTGMGAVVGTATPSTATQAVDGALAAIREMILSHAPSSRHENIVAVLNVAFRLGVLDACIEMLEGDEVRIFWCSDNSRTDRAWKNEIKRWSDAVREKNGKGYGLPYLNKQGFDVAAVCLLIQANVKLDANQPGFNRALPDASDIRKLGDDDTYTSQDALRLLGYEWSVLNSDVSLAARLSLYYGSEVRYAIGLGWLVWTGNRWRMD